MAREEWRTKVSCEAYIRKPESNAINCLLFHFPDILALSESIRGLSVASKRTRCAMWSALQLTILVNVDKDLAVGDKAPGDERLLNPEIEEDKVEVDTGVAETASFNGRGSHRAEGSGIPGLNRGPASSSSISGMIDFPIIFMRLSIVYMFLCCFKIWALVTFEGTD